STSVATIIFNKLVKLSTPLFTSSVTYIIPIVAVLWGVLDGEQLYLNHYLGMIAIIGGVYLANVRKSTGAIVPPILSSPEPAGDQNGSPGRYSSLVPRSVPISTGGCKICNRYHCILSPPLQIRRKYPARSQALNRSA